MGKDAPKAPDPSESARAQARANRINQITPFGSMMFFEPGQTVPQQFRGTVPGTQPSTSGGLTTQPVGQPRPVQSGVADQIARLQREIANQPDEGPRRQLEQRLRGLQMQQSFGGGGGPAAGTAAPGAPTFDRATAITTLAPEQQQILDLQQDIARQLGLRAGAQAEALPAPGSPVFSGLPDLSLDQGARDRIEQAQFDRAMSLLNPQFERRQEQQLQRLANQGLPQASRAFRSERQDFMEERSRAEEQAALASILAGEDALQRQFGRQLGARQQLGQEQLAERSIPLNEIMSLLGLQQIQQPQFFAPGQVDLLGAQQQDLAAQQARFGAQQQMFGGLLGLGGQLGAAALLA